MKFKLSFTAAAGSVVLAALLAGCGEKESALSAPPVEAPVPVQAQPAGNAAAPSVPASVAPDQRLQETQAALKAGEYDKAAATLVALQRTQLNEQQAAAAAAQMKQLQSSLASALASGDPRAKAAADRLRQAAMAR
jgi:hypothetical protein